MTTDENAPAALERDEGTETHVAARLTSTVPPTSASIADLLRSRPRPGAPADEVAAWVTRKVSMLALIEAATG